jgi:hypothetical protein
VAPDPSGSADAASKLILAIFILSGAASRHGGLQRKGSQPVEDGGSQPVAPAGEEFLCKFLCKAFTPPQTPERKRAPCLTAQDNSRRLRTVQLAFHPPAVSVPVSVQLAHTPPLLRCR